MYKIKFGPLFLTHDNTFAHKIRAGLFSLDQVLDWISDHRDLFFEYDMHVVVCDA